MLALLRRLNQCDAWANHLLFDVMRRTPSLPEPKLAVYQHLLRAEQAWLLRLTGKDPSTTPIWETPTLADSEELLGLAADAMAAYFQTLNTSQLDATFSYRDSQGTEYTNTVADALMHLLLHSARHRGEVAAALGDAGADVPPIDFIAYLRAGEPLPNP
jgi:uncharacterized damage-inducible protein DinB